MAASLLHDLLPIKSQRRPRSSVNLRWTNAVIFPVREVCNLNCVTLYTVRLDTRNSRERNQTSSGPHESVTGNMILPNFLASCEFRYIEGAKEAGRRDKRGT